MLFRSFITAVSGLEAMSPIKVMCRGYSLVYKNGRIISNSSELKPGDKVDIKLYKGSITAEIKERTVENEV